MQQLKSITLIIGLAVTIGTVTILTRDGLFAHESREGDTAQSYEVVSKEGVRTALVQRFPTLAPHFLYRVRLDSTGCCLYIHCKPKDFSGNGVLVRIGNEDAEIVEEELPSPYVWWDDGGNIVASSSFTPYMGFAVGHKQGNLAGVHLVQLPSGELRFGKEDQKARFDMSEDGKLIYVITEDVGSISIQLKILSAESPQHLLLEREYRQIPRLFVRNGILHVFSEKTGKYSNYHFTHERFQVSSEKLDILDVSEFSARKISFSAMYRVFGLSADADYVYLSCVVDMPFGALSHYQRVSMDNHLAEKLDGIGMGASLIPIPKGQQSLGK